MKCHVGRNTLNNPSKSAYRCEERAQLFSSTVWALWAELIYCQSTGQHGKAQHILPAVITYVRLRLQQIMSSLLKDSEPLTPPAARGTVQLKRPQSQTQTLNAFIWMVIYFTNTAKEIYVNVIISAVKRSRLIASKIKVFVYIIYEYVLCIFIMYTVYKYKHMHVYI